MMSLKRIAVVSLIIFGIPISFLSAAQPLTFSSGDQPVQLIELYTSQGCSSCPPAERWLNKFKSDKRLWKDIVPVNFHVDYWDYLGWRDPYASKQFTLRQHQHRLQGNVNSVYTLGFVLDGKEWKGWFSRDPLPSVQGSQGVLSATLVGDELKVDYSRKADGLQLNVAILGFDIVTSVKQGENHGRQLPHEFVVMGMQRHAGKGDWQVPLPEFDDQLAGKFGLAVWVSSGKRLGPLQALGGWLPEGVLQRL